MGINKSNWIVCTLLLIHTGLLAWSSSIHSPNIDEVGHMPAGLAIWHYGNTKIYRVNPPLIKAIAALPVYLSRHKTDWSFYLSDPTARTEWILGNDFIAANGKRAFYLFTIARWACIPLSLLGALVCYFWARELYGVRSGILALICWCFSPNILAWGASITPDSGAASLGVASCYFFWKWLKAPTWKTAIPAGILLGLAQLTKTTWIILFVYWPCAWILWNTLSLTLSRQQWLAQIRQMALILVLGLYFINLGYGFSGSFRPLGNYEFTSTTLNGIENPYESEQFTGNRFANTWMGQLPVPLPEDYLTGIDIQKQEFEKGKWSYLRGEHKFGGWWYYYLYAAVIKIPIGFWILAGLSACLTIRKYSSDRLKLRNELFLLFPALLILTFVSSQTGFSRYFRYLLPAFPFVFIWMSKCAANLNEQNWKQRWILYSATTWAIISSLWIYPHSLSYFNEFVGGPRGGPAHLLDANIDWGQDLLLLKQWIDRHPEAEPIYVNCFSQFDVPLAGIKALSVPSEPAVGWYAISVHQLFNRRGSDEYLHRLKPVTTIGYSIYIFQITEEDLERLKTKGTQKQLP